MRVLPLLLLLAPSLALAGAKVSATNTSSRDKGMWSAGNAIDGKTTTAWMVPGESDNKGEWIELDVPKGEVDKIAIFPGFGKDEDTFGDYPRVKKLRVDVIALDDDQQAKTVGTHTVEVADKAELQVIDIPDTKVDAGLFGGKVRITVEDVYEGADFPNLALSEVSILLKEFDAEVDVQGASADGGDGYIAVVDQTPTSSWRAPAGSEITLSMGSYGISSLGFLSTGKDAARPKTIELTIGAQQQTTVLADKPGEVQWVGLPAFNGYNGGAMGEIVVKIVDSYPGAKVQDVAVAEIKARATSRE
jgi:hypothetical protein